MKNIPLNAPVYCRNQRCGQMTFIIINPQTKRVTHLVVKDAAASYLERLVPIEAIAETLLDRIQLRCSQDAFKRMDPFIAIERHAEMVPDYDDFKFTCQYWYPVPQKRIWVETEWKQIPLGEIAVPQATRIQATDGFLGTMAGLRIEPTSRQISHLLMNRGLPWNRRQIAVPIQQIDQVNDNIVYLRIDKHTVDELADARIHQKLSRKKHLAEQV